MALNLAFDDDELTYFYEMSRKILLMMVKDSSGGT